MPSQNPEEGQMDKLEAQLPAASGAAFSNAYDQAIQAGLSVMISDNGGIYEVFPDGQRKLVKEIAPPTTMQSGLKIKFR